MDRRGPRIVVESGVAIMTAGLLLAPLVREAWHLYLTLGLLVGAGGNCLAYTAHALFLPTWFVRRRGLAMSVAFSGVGVGSIIVLPWLQAIIGRDGWRAACSTMGILVFGLLAPLNLVLKRTRGYLNAIRHWKSESLIDPFSAARESRRPKS
jgi:MFS family permease